jgi:hypothetical protein
MKQLLALFLLTLSLVACNKPAQSDPPAVNSANKEAPQDEPEAMGNAQDTLMPNTMALAAEYQQIAHYTGTIGGKIEAKVTMRRLYGVARGTITYKKSGKPITLIGRMEEDSEGSGTFFMREFQPDGLVTGVLSGSLKDGSLTGNWYGTGDGKELSLNLADTGEEPDGSEWPYDVKGSVAGKYGYHYPGDKEGNPGAEGVLTVKQNGDKITYTFDCVTGGPGYNMAMMEDTEGTLEGNEVRFSSTEYGDCAFVIRFFDGFAVVEHEDGKYECGFGHNASVEGEFVKLP